MDPRTSLAVRGSQLATPSQLGYRMPAEWEPHEATWLTWPRREGISFPDRYEGIPEYWMEMCKRLSPHERVHINVFDKTQEKEIRSYFKKTGLKIGQRIFLHPFPAYEPWCRDHGPTFLVRKVGNREQGTENRIKKTASHQPPTANSLALVDWNYNAWGGKYPPFDLDDRMPEHVAKFLKIPIFKPGIVMEGGAIDVNGQGSLLTTESCLLNKNRNPHLSKPEIEKYLRDFLGVEKILWLGEGIEGDDTDGHVDDLARFIDPRTVVAVLEEDPADPNYKILQDNLKRLKSMKDQDGKPLRVVTLPMPGYVEFQGQRLPASYANFYIANRVALLPVYGHLNDMAARETLQKLFPKRKVIPINCRDLVWGLGAFHCVTQQQPKVNWK